MSAAPARRPRPVPVHPRDRPARPPHLRVAPVVARRRRARLAVWGLAVVSVSSLFLLVAFHVVAAQHAFTLDRLTRERAAEERRYERLREQVATLSSPPAVVAAAARLGMVPASREGFLVVPGAALRRDGEDGATSSLASSYTMTKPSLGNP